MSIHNDGQLNALYSTLAFYAHEAAASVSTFTEGSVYADIERTMADIKARRAALKEVQ